MRKLLLTIGLGLAVALIGAHAPSLDTPQTTAYSMGVSR